MGIGRDITNALDPVLVLAGFAAGQGVGPDDDLGAPVGITYCAGHDAFSDRFPWMPQANEYERAERACIDLVIEVSAEGFVECIDLESFSVAETLLLTGRVDESRSVANFIGKQSTDVLAHLPGILDRLFRDGP